jgi:hypothetical protein
MAQTVENIESGIARTAARLGSSVGELEDEFYAVTDWREHFHTHPWMVLGAAGVVGFILGAALKPDEGHEDGRRAGYVPNAGQLRPMLDDFAEALVLVASARVKDVIAGMIPGFQEQLARIEERATTR